MVIALFDLLSAIRRRKADLAVADTPERTDELRNNGSRRTPQKRAALARIEERAHCAGVEPLKANF